MVFQTDYDEIELQKVSSFQWRHHRKTSPCKIMSQNFSLLGTLQSKFLATPTWWRHIIFIKNWLQVADLELSCNRDKRKTAFCKGLCSGVAGVPCVLGQEIFLRLPSTETTEFEVKNRCKSAEEANAEH